MRKTFKYRIYANARTIERAEDWLELCRRLYNTALEQRISIYRQNKGRITYNEQARQLPDLKTSFPQYYDIDSEVIYDVLLRLDRTYQNFFRYIKYHKNGGFPHFKFKERYNSFTLMRRSWKLQGKYLFVRNVGVFKLFLSRPVEGIIKTITIERALTGKWFACFSCNDTKEASLVSTNREIGIDMGIKAFCVDSEGNKFDNPLYLKSSQALLRRRQRRVARRVKGSNGNKDAKLLVAKAHEKIKNQRNDFIKKVADYYTNNYDTIYIENLNIKGMSKNHHLSKAILDSAWGYFFNFLIFKAKEKGKIVVKVNPYNTTQVCSNCGEKVCKSLLVRIHKCPYCGLVIDRDWNAALNILKTGQVLLGT
jgi:putative transposase